MIPDDVDNWDLSLVEELTSKGVFESDQFDFKLRLPDSRDSDGKRRIRKTIAAFANSGGGYLVFGVGDQKGVSSENRLVGVEISVDLPEQFGNHASFCEPSVEWKFKNPPIPLSNGNVIHVVQVLSTWRRPHSVEFSKGSLIFPKRTNKGNEEMSYGEVRSAFHEAEFRRAKLSLLVSELDFMKQTAQRLLSQIPDPLPELDGTLHWAWATRYNTTLVDQTLGDTFSLFSDNLELWNTLCLVRDSAKHSNVACEALTEIAYLSMSNKKKINEEHYKLVQSCAKQIVDNSSKAIELLKEVLS